MARDFFAEEIALSKNALDQPATKSLTKKDYFTEEIGEVSPEGRQSVQINARNLIGDVIRKNVERVKENPVKAFVEPLAVTPEGKSLGQVIEKKLQLGPKPKVDFGTAIKTALQAPFEVPYRALKPDAGRAEYFKSLTGGIGADVADIATTPMTYAIEPALKGFGKLATKIPIGKSNLMDIAQTPFKLIPKRIKFGRISEPKILPTIANPRKRVQFLEGLRQLKNSPDRIARIKAKNVPASEPLAQPVPIPAGPITTPEPQTQGQTVVNPEGPAPIEIKVPPEIKVQTGAKASKIPLQKAGQFTAQKPITIDDVFTPAKGLTAEEQKLEKFAFDYLKENFETALKDYKKRILKEFGSDRVVSGDEAKFIIPGATPETMAIYHEPASAFAKVYKNMLLSNPETAEMPGVLMAGGSGAGKTRTVREIGNLNKYAIVIDTNTNNVASGVKNLQEILGTGRGAGVLYVERDPLVAWNSVIDRYLKTRRPVPADVHITNQGARDAVKKLYNQYKSNPDVEFRFIDNNGQTAKEVPFDKLPKYNYTSSGAKEALRRRLNERISERITENTLTEEQAAPLRSKARTEKDYGRVSQKRSSRLESDSKQTIAGLKKDQSEILQYEADTLKDIGGGVRGGTILRMEGGGYKRTALPEFLKHPRTGKKPINSKQWLELAKHNLEVRKTGQYRKDYEFIQAEIDRLSPKRASERGAVRIGGGNRFEGMNEEQLRAELKKFFSPSADKKFPDKATIRFDKYSKKTQPLVKEIQETFDISGKTRGTMSIKEINRRAKDGSLSVDQLANLPEGTALNAEELQRARALAQDAIKTADSMLDKFLKAPSTDDNALADAVAATKLAVDTLTSTRAAMSEAGRALRILRESVASKIRIPEGARQAVEGMDREAFRKFAEGFRAEIEKGNVEGAKKLLAEQTKRNIWDQITDLSNALLLTNPNTDIVNFIGNTLANVASVGEKVMIGSVDNVRAKLTKTPRERFAGESTEEAFATIEGVKEGVVDGIDEMLKSLIQAAPKTSQTQASAKASKVSGFLRKGLKTGRTLREKAGVTEEVGKPVELMPGQPKEGIDRVSEAIFGRLGAEDAFFKGIKRRQSINAQAYRIAKQEGRNGLDMAARIKELRENPSTQMLNLAEKDAAEVTFQEELGRFTKQVNTLRKFPLVRAVIPFFKTPMNLLKFTARRSPFAMTPGTKSFRQIIGKMGPAEQSEAIGKMIFGSVAMLPIAIIAAEGLLTGAGPKSRKRYNVLKAEGWQPYSIKIGDTYYSYRRLEPLSTAIASIATIIDRAGEDSEDSIGEKILNATTTISGFVTDQTFWQGLREIQDWARGRNPRFVENFISGRLAPPGLAQIARSTDEYARDPEGIIEAFKARIPGLSKDVPPRLDIFGRPLKNEAIGPFYTSKDKSDKVTRELYKYDVSVPQQGKTLRGVELERHERFQINTEVGPMAKKLLNAMVRSKGYDQLSDFQKEKLLEKIINAARSGVQKRFDQAKKNV